ncbi:MAG: cytochrome c peroxidase [Pseudomonadota bacterium]
MRLRAVIVVGLALLGAGLARQPGLAQGAAHTDPVGALSPAAALGRKLFFDTSLSASGQLSCASCHSPTHAYGPPDGRAVRIGGATLDLEGTRAVPSLRYVLNRTPVWTEDVTASEAERIREPEMPVGGYGWDGRFDSLHEQAAFPLLAANEMANAGPEAVAAKLRVAPYAEEFRRVFGADVFDDPRVAFTQAGLALERFEFEDPDLHPYSSRFDQYLDGKLELTAQERRGLALFDDPERGNCSSCHVDERGADGSHPLFTDYEMEALGVPRNPELRANADARYFDMGLCGPLRQDQSANNKYCGLFKTPTLRNVTTRRVFFHNGRFHTLRDALRFYVRRDTEPLLWYPAAAGGIAEKFDDLPPDLRDNVDRETEPLTRAMGEPPVWSDAEIEDVMAFLRTLNDADVADAAP